jgi:hypothetical protein
MLGDIEPLDFRPRMHPQGGQRRNGEKVIAVTTAQ